MERYIAIDNVCAWPNLTKMPDGSIVAAIFNQPCHGHWEGDVECWASEDGGRTWRLRGTAAPHEPGTNRMNVAAGLAADGDLVVLASGWDSRPKREDSNGTFEGRAGAGKARTLPPWICRSSDGGRTWQRSGGIPPPEGVRNAIPFGDIVQLADGSLGVFLYGGNAACFYISQDEGRTWVVRSTLQATEQSKGIGEATPLALPGGELLACARTVHNQYLELFRSTDHGRTWAHQQAVSGPGEHPAQLLNLPDGRVLLSYGDRSGLNGRGAGAIGRPSQGTQGVKIRISPDAGKTWSAPRQLVCLDPSDLGYPSTVPGNDGTLVTAWYSSGIAAHQRYHMGAAVWKLDEALSL